MKDTKILKRVLRYARKNRTDTHKRYALWQTRNGRSGPVLKLEGKVEAWGQMVRYTESLLRDVQEAEEAQSFPTETVAEVKVEVDIGAYDE